MDLLLTWVWQGSLVALVATGVLWAVPTLSAATRYCVWWVALGVVLLLPLTYALADAAWVPATGPRGPLGSGVVPLPSVPLSVLAGLLVAWGGATLFGLARLVHDVRRLRQSKARVTPMPADVERRLPRWRAARDHGRAASLGLTDEGRVASVLGLGAPVIVVPRVLVDTLTDAELDQVVLHEYAHVERRDDWANLLQVLVAVPCGAHPAVWLVNRGIRRERELAADDWAATRCAGSAGLRAVPRQGRRDGALAWRAAAGVRRERFAGCSCSSRGPVARPASESCTAAVAARAGRDCGRGGSLDHPARVAPVDRGVRRVGRDPGRPAARARVCAAGVRACGTRTGAGFGCEADRATCDGVARGGCAPRPADRRIAVASARRAGRHARTRRSAVPRGEPWSRPSIGRAGSSAGRVQPARGQRGRGAARIPCGRHPRAVPGDQFVALEIAGAGRSVCWGMVWWGGSGDGERVHRRRRVIQARVHRRRLTRALPGGRGYAFGEDLDIDAGTSHQP